MPPSLLLCMFKTYHIQNVRTFKYVPSSPLSRAHKYEQMQLPCVGSVAQSYPTLCSSMDCNLPGSLHWQAGSLPLAPPGKLPGSANIRYYSKSEGTNLRYP